MKFEKVRVRGPKGVKVLFRDERRAKFQLSGTTNVRLFFAVIFALTFGIGGLLYIFFLSDTPLIAFLIWGALVAFLGKQIQEVKVVFYVTPSAVTIADKNYDRRQWGGFYHGGTEERYVAQTSRHGQTSGRTYVSHRLGFYYGGHPCDMPYRFSQGNITHIVGWMNDCVSDIPLENNAA